MHDVSKNLKSHVNGKGQSESETRDAGLSRRYHDAPSDDSGQHAVEFEKR